LNRLRYSAPAIAALTVVLVAAVTSAATRDIWFQSTIGDEFMGYTHETVVEGDDGLVTTSLESDLGVQRGDELVSVIGTDVWVESADGTPVSYEQTRKMAARTMTLTVTVDPGRLRIRKSDGSDALFSSVEYEGKLLFPAAIERLHRDKGFKKGSTYSFRTFDADFAEVATYQVTVGGRRDFEIMGGTHELTELMLTCDLYKGVEFVEWRSADGELWREEYPDVGGVLERTTEDVATRERTAGEVLSVTSIASNVEFTRPRSVDEAVYELWIEGDDHISEIVPEDARQSIVGTTERGILLRVSRVVPDMEDVADFPVRSTPLKDYLDGNALMQTWYPRLLGTAAKAVWGSDQNIWKGATQIERWVYDYVVDKGPGTAFASAREVLESRSGDCSEHAVLMAAMTRAVGIPTKLAAGIVYDNGAFAYHIWVEVWTGDGWYALDPTVGAGSVDATHIKLTESAVRGGRVADLSVGIMRVFNRLGLKVVEYTVDGKTVEVSD
jgi:hypothetical protein